MNRDYTMCTNNECTRKDECKRYVQPEMYGAFWIVDHKGKCDNCKDFATKDFVERNW